MRFEVVFSKELSSNQLIIVNQERSSETEESEDINIT